MLHQPLQGLFVAGVGTEVGKTYIAALIARGLLGQGKRVGVYKPVASGCRSAESGLVCDDAVALWEAAGRPGALDRVCPQCFAAPLAPPVAARSEGKLVDAALLRHGLEYWASRCDVVIVEGAGGLMSPVSEDDYVADLAYEFGYPVVVVADNTLGVINQTLQTLITAAVFRDGLKIAGVVLNDTRPARHADVSAASNREQLEAHCTPPVLAHIGYGDRDWPTSPKNIHWLSSLLINSNE